jgi:hypothetical protein
MLGLFMLGGGEIVLILMLLFLVPLGLAAFAFWIWMLIDAIKNQRLTDGQKIAWVLVILFLHFLGALIYFLAGRSRTTSVTAA